MNDEQGYRDRPGVSTGLAMMLRGRRVTVVAARARREGERGVEEIRPDPRPRVDLFEVVDQL